MKNIRNRKNLLFLHVCSLVLALACLVCVGIYAVNTRLLPDQKAWQRWQGESETEFSQISCFLPLNEKLTKEQIFSFRTAMYTKLKEASFELGSGETLFVDAWSCKGSAKAANGHRNGNLSVIAVGGDYFSFHPLRLLDGSYLNPGDLMKDRVLLDEQSAWLLFGGTQLAGMSFYLEGVPVTVAGVIQRETDTFSKKAYDGDAGIYMDYDTYLAIKDSAAAISCYELLMADPVKNFAVNAVKEKFPVKGAEILENSKRYQTEKIFELLRGLNMRTMRTDNVVYPYWENAARLSEESCARLMFGVLLFAIMPVICIAAWIYHGVKSAFRKLDEDLIPNAREKTEEAVRAAQRKRWERKHGISK